MNINIAELYFKKWDELLFSTQTIDKIKAKNAVENAYHFCDVQVPEIFFFQSPFEAKLLLENISFSTDNYPYLKYNLESEILPGKKIVSENLYSQIDVEDRLSKYSERAEKFKLLCKLIYQNTVYSVVNSQSNPFFIDILELEFSRTDFWLYDWHMNSIKDESDAKTWTYDLRSWNIFKSLCEECPFILPFNDACIIIDRPCELYMDRELLTHAEGKAAIKFRDGYEIYCNHGIKIPAQYGKIHPSNWQSTWILAESQIEDKEKLLNTLLINIGYQKFCKELPGEKANYWKNHQDLIAEAINKIIDWQFFHYYDFYHLESEANSQKMCDRSFQQLTKDIPYKISQELHSLYLSYNGEYQIAPKLYFYPLEQGIQNQMHGLQSSSVRLFHGDRQEIYYVLCDHQERLISPVYCQFPDAEPVIYAECVTSLIVTIAQCYQEGAYYIAIDEETGERSIEQDLDKIEPIFEKFNPDRIDNWRKIWKS
jgi:hypothetical protein